MSVTLELPEDLTQQLSLLPASTRNRFTAAALRGGLSDLQKSSRLELKVKDFDDYADTVEAIQEALAHAELHPQKDFREYASEVRQQWKLKGYPVA